MPSSIHFMPTWLWNMCGIVPQPAVYGLAFFKDSRVAALVDHNEAVCAVRKLRAEPVSAVS